MRSLNFSFLLLIAYLCFSQLHGNTPRPQRYDFQTTSKATIESQPIASQIDAFLTAAGVRGGVLIAKDGKIILNNGYGWADEKRKIAITPRTVFDIGSVTKQFTGTAILKLQEEGKLKVTDTLTRFFKDVPADKQNISVHQLLTHTAGFAHDVVEYAEYPKRDVLVQKTLDFKLKLKPGEKYSYSNAGYTLLAAIVEIASGMPYEDYLCEKLWSRAGMMKTGYTLPAWTDEEIAHGFDMSGDLGAARKIWEKDGPSWATRGAGGVLSTLEDLYKWHLALEGETILSEKSKQDLFTPHVPENDQGTSHYGYGWAVIKTPRQTRLITHDGSNGTFFADFHRYLDENVVIIYFTSERNSVSRAAIRIVPSMFFGNGVTSLPSSTIKLTPTELVNYAGTYQLPSGDEFVLDVHQNQLSTEAATWGICRLLTSFPKLEDSERLHGLEPRVVSTVESIVHGEFERVREALYFDGTPEEEKAYWARTCAAWKERFGLFKRSGVIGTVADKSYLNTYVLLQFERGTTILQFRQNAEGKFNIGTSNNLLPHDYRLIPQSKTGFFVYNHTLRIFTQVNFDFDGKNVTEVSTC